MGRSARLASLVLLILFSGCSLKGILDHAAPETVAQAKSEVNLLRHHQFDRIEPSLDPSIDRTAFGENLAKMAALIPPQEPRSVKTVGVWAECDSRRGCDTEVSLEYEFPGQWLLAQMTVQRANGKSVITSFHVQQLTDSLEHINRFTLLGKTPLQYALLLSAIAAFAICVYALVLCIRTPMARRKWLWIVFILFGIGRVDVNWTTGELLHRIFHVLLFSAGTVGQPYGPWTIMVAIPLGAILFLTFRHRLTKPEIPAAPTEASPSSAPAV